MNTMTNKLMFRKTTDHTCRHLDRVPRWRMLFILLFACTMFGVVAASAQTVYVGIETKTVDGVAKPGVKVWIGKYSVTTGEGGSASLNIPAGTHTARAETKCRVVRASASSNLQPGGRTELVLTFSLPQDLPAGILFELECKKPRVRGKPKVKTG